MQSLREITQDSEFCSLSFIGLTPYTLRIKPKKERKAAYLPINKFDGKTDLLDVIRKSILAPGIQNVPDQANKSFEPHTQLDKDRILDGTFSVGQSGFGSVIKEPESKDNFKRTVNHSEFVPMYFKFNASLPDETKCLAMLQTFNKTGVKSIIDKRLKQEFLKNYSDFTLHFNRVLTKEMAKQLFDDSPIKRLRFVQRKVPKDLADKINAGPQHHEGEIELVLKAKGENPFGLRSKVEEFLSGDRKLTEIIEFGDIDYEAVKVELDVDGRTRTLSLSRLDGLNATFDISEAVECDADKHPKLDSIRALAVEYEQNFID